MRTILAAVLSLSLAGQGLALAQAGPPTVQGPPAKPTTSTPSSKPAAQAPSAKPVAPAPSAIKPAAPAGSAPVVPVDPGYTIGPEDVLGVLVWRDQDLTGDVTVRPDGMITLPLVRDIKAVGLTPTQLADRIQEAVREYSTDASVTVVVRQINSRRVFITGEVAHPGAYPLGSMSMTVMQLIAVAGGLTEYAKAGKISVLRVDAGRSLRFAVDYLNVARGKKPEQNILLKPGDTVVVPER